MEPTDEALVLACRRGDTAAWEGLIQRYQRLIYSIPRRAGLAEDVAGEVFQQVFATFLEYLDHIEQPARVRAWLVTTARRETWRVGRRARRDRTATSPAAPLDSDGTTGDDATRDLPDGEPLPEEVVQRLEDQHVVRTALASLDERCRRLLALLYYRPDPPSYGEIAAQFGTAEGSIGPTRARCLKKLRRALQHLGF